MKTKDLDVFILCGGLGKRVRSISGNTPKVMMKVGNRHFLDIIIEYMLSFGFRRYILGIGHKASTIKNYYNGHSPSRSKIIFSYEKSPLDTGGAVKKAQKLIKSNSFFVLNGDSFCRFNPIHFLKFHKMKSALASILLQKKTEVSDYGFVTVDKNSRITGFSEKDSSQRKSFINAGVYIFDKAIFDLMPHKQRFSLEYDLFPRLAGSSFFGYQKSSFFIDIGTPKRYFKAVKYFQKYQI